MPNVGRVRAALESLFAFCVVKLLPGVAHFFMRCLHIVRFFLLFGSEQRPNLSHGLVHQGLRLLHRLLMDSGELRLRLIDDRLNLRLLIGSQIQRFTHLVERIAMMPAHLAMAVSAMSAMSGTLGKGPATDGECSSNKQRR